MLNPDNVGDFPDHTEEIERFAEHEAIEEVVPQHMGGPNVGRFCVSMLVISDELGKVLALQPTGESGSLNFETVFEFEILHDYDVFGKLWNKHVFFRWGDREGAERAKLTGESYARRFTTGEAIPENLIPEIVDEKIARKERGDAPDCNCERHHVRDEEVTPIQTEVSCCMNCGRPYSLSMEGLGGSLFRTARELDWIEGEFGGGTEPIENSDLRFYSVDSKSDVKIADGVLHCLTRLSKLDHPNFLRYIGVNQQGMLIGDPSIGKCGEIVGYLLWNWPGSVPRAVLQQLHILEEFRGNGYAKSLVDTWFNQTVSDNWYYAYDPNSAGMAFLRSCGHILDDRDCPAVPAEVWTSNDTHGGDRSPREEDELWEQRGF